jgi:hypothetical protein
MDASGPSLTAKDKFVLPPDGKQTRIDFFPRKNNREWWHSLTAWLKSSRQEKDRKIEHFSRFLASRNYSSKTIRSYIYMLEKFFEYLDDKDIDTLSFGVIEDYNYDFFVSGRYSRSYQLQFINSLSLYLEFSEKVKVNLKGLRRSAMRRK